MGLAVNINREGKYQIISGSSDEILHEEKWISKDEAKKILIERAYIRFLEQAIEIDLEFPAGYSTTKFKRHQLKEGQKRGCEYMLEIYGEKSYKRMFEDYNKMVDRLDLFSPKIEDTDNKEIDNRPFRRQIYFYLRNVENWSIQALQTISSIEVVERDEKYEVTVTTHSPGIFIGKAGRTIDAVRDCLVEHFKKEVKVLLKENHLWNYNKEE